MIRFTNSSIRSDFNAVSKAPLWKDFLRGGVFLVVGVFAFATGYEHFPRTGWVDASIYNSYVVVDDAYEYVEGFGWALSGATYQFSRLSHILPPRVLGELLGVTEGRFVYNFLLFFTFAVAAISITVVNVSNPTAQVLVSGFLILNPQLISSIVYGGADGPAAIYSFISLVFLFFAAQNKSNLLFIFSGACLGLAISAHIFAIVPFSFALIALSFGAQKLSFRQFRNYGKYAFPFFCGLALIVLLFHTIGHQLGLSNNYLIYNAGRIRSSGQGLGAKFLPPFDHWLQNAMLWMGLILFLACSIFLVAKYSVFGSSDEQRSRRKVAILSFSLPLIFVIFFDLLIGGSMTATPHYFNAFLPCIGIGVVFLVASWDGSEGMPLRHLCFFFSAAICFGISVFLPNNGALFAHNKIDSKSLLLSQHSFQQEIAVEFDRKIFNLVYSGPIEDNSEHRKYIDYYGGTRRVFDYLDSLAYTLPWISDKMHRVDPTISPKALISLKSGIPTVVFSTTKIRLDETLEMIPYLAGDISTASKKCGGYEPYQWCIAVIK